MVKPRKKSIDVTLPEIGGLIVCELVSIFLFILFSENQCFATVHSNNFILYFNKMFLTAVPGDYISAT
jgi:hypothetical protein